MISTESNFPDGVKEYLDLLSHPAFVIVLSQFGVGLGLNGQVILGLCTLDLSDAFFHLGSILQNEMNKTPIFFFFFEGLRWRQLCCVDLTLFWQRRKPFSSLMGCAMYSSGGSNEPLELAIFKIFFFIHNIFCLFIYLTLLNKNLNTLTLNFFKTTWNKLIVIILIIFWSF